MVLRAGSERMHIVNKALKAYREYLLTHKQVVPVKHFTDPKDIFITGLHTLIQGITGSGKTTLLLQLEYWLVKMGYKVLKRDDSGLEFLFMLPKIGDRTVIYVPDHPSVIADIEDVDKYGAEIYRFVSPKDIVDDFESRNKGTYAVVVYDLYVLDIGKTALFWNSFLNRLIKNAMQKPYEEKENIVLSIDEINDLIQPGTRAMTEEHRKVAGQFELGLRKLRKHKIKIIATTHRFNMISINARSQFHNIIIKKSFGWDVYDFVSKSLIQLSSKQFWAILGDIISLPPSQMYYFNNEGNFDKFTIPDINRDLPFKYDFRGVIDEEEGDPLEQVLEAIFDLLKDYNLIPRRWIRGREGNRSKMLSEFQKSPFVVDLINELYDILPPRMIVKALKYAENGDITEQYVRKLIYAIVNKDKKLN